ncbi:MAG: site-specific DNA-methyltransferase [Bacteroidetes bacterium]|nr:site-specific DNA-methyltransferase [Bacteroidota bacterium]
MKKIVINKIEDIKKIISRKDDDVSIINFPIYLNDIVTPFINSSENKNSFNLISKILRASINTLSDGGVMFIYGSPIQLIKSFEVVSNEMKFRHWISIDVVDSIEKTSTDHLKNNHLGVLMLTKGDKYFINPGNVRIPYIGCSACFRNIRDWGGKKHLMNNKGSAVSDVWRDFFKVEETRIDPDNELINLNIIDSTKINFNFSGEEIPKPIIERIISLVEKENIIITNYSISKEVIKPLNKISSKNGQDEKTKEIIINDDVIDKVLLGDCIEQMEELLVKYPNGVFDLVFADPPYNLSKEYKIYDDTLASKEYIEWCNKWLELCVKLTKPSGSIFVLNIPKWALYHAQLLNRVSYFQDWIVWDSLSTPKGKIMPSHYALLHYSKSAASTTFNFPGFIDSPEYCIRSSCIQARKKSTSPSLFAENNERLNRTQSISNIWSDLHRIKHKKDRDDHPCQLPNKLMDRIIKVYSNKGDLVFDPFAGAGTTAIRAIINERHYTTIEIDPYYKEITEKKLEEVKLNGDIKRKVTNKKNKSIYTKKELELKSQKLATELGRKPTMEEFINTYALDASQIELLYSDPINVLKVGRIGLLNSR